MRFNAFNFAGMKKSTIWVLGIVMGLSFLSLLYLQVSYIEEMVKMRKGQFDESVQRSLVQACRNILSWWKLKSTLRMMRLLQKKQHSYPGSSPKKKRGREVVMW